MSCPKIKTLLKELLDFVLTEQQESQNNLDFNNLRMIRRSCTIRNDRRITNDIYTFGDKSHLMLQIDKNRTNYINDN